MKKRLALALVLIASLAAKAQIIAPQINLSGNIGCQGFPCFNGGNINLTSDADHTLTALETSAIVVSVTSSVALTATRNIVAPAGYYVNFVYNATTGAQSITWGGSSGAKVTIAPGTGAVVGGNGTLYWAPPGGSSAGAVLLNPASNASQTIAGPLVVNDVNGNSNTGHSFEVDQGGGPLFWLQGGNASNNPYFVGTFLGYYIGTAIGFPSYSYCADYSTNASCFEIGPVTALEANTTVSGSIFNSARSASSVQLNNTGAASTVDIKTAAAINTTPASDVTFATAKTTFHVPVAIDSIATSPSTSPICPNGTGGTLTTTGCSGGGAGYSNYGGISTYGDSITQGTGASNFMAQGSLASGYAQDLISDFGGSGQNYGYGGDQAADMSFKVYATANPAMSNNPVATMMISTNDVNVYGTNANQQNIFLRSLEGSIGWASTPDISKTLTSNTANCVRGGTWAVDSGALRQPQIYSITSGSTLSCTVTVPTGSTAIYYGYQACDGYTGGSAAITIDGSSPGTDATVISTGQGGAAISTSNGSTCGNFLARYPVSSGTHTFLITTQTGNVVEPQWVGSPYPAAAITPAPPIVFVGGTPWNNGNTPSTTTAAYNTIISGAVSAMAGDGAPVYFVDIRNGVNSRNSNTATALNSTTDYAGGQQGNITCPASSNLPYHPNSSATYSRSCGHGHLAANFEAAIGIKSGGPSPNPVIDGRELVPNGYSTTDAATVLSLNGDPRQGNSVGMAFGYSADPNLHLRVPTTSGGFTFEQVNSPAPGVAPTVTTIAQIISGGFSSPSTSPYGFVSSDTTSTALSINNTSGTGEKWQIEVAGGGASFPNNGLIYHDVTEANYPFWYSAGSTPGLWTVSGGLFGWSSNATDPRTGGSGSVLDTGIVRHSAGYVCASASPLSATCNGTLGLSSLISVNGTFSALSTAGIVTNTSAGLLGSVAAVPVANGGTGLATLTSGSALIGAGTGNVTFKALAGAGAGLTTGPTTSVSTDLADFTGTAGQVADSGVLLANVAVKNAANTFTAPQTATQLIQSQGENVVTFSTTPAFLPTYLSNIITLTASLTSWTMAAGSAGQIETLTFCQNGTGSFTTGTTPSNVRGLFTIGTTASKCSSQEFVYSANQTAWLATSTGVINQ